MELDKKVVAAISAGVTSYIQAQKAAERAARTRLAVRTTADLWSQSGRQQIMRNREMWQLRIVPK
ncbi:MAG: hypothetical protein JSV16_13905 [Candidatus Hydrogenedentota bacterium]|nr:MAG: hypothetical protein JSV16_13905 [Candidatus Hydrogenedentota bacterium]